MPLSWRATILSSFIAPTIIVDFSSAQHAAEVSRASLPTLQCNVHARRQRCRMNSLIGDLWDEMIEMATYGPGERKILAERRKRAARSTEAEGDTQSVGKEMSFSEARKRFDADDDGGSNDNTSSEGDLTPAAFRQAAAAVSTPRNDNNNEPPPYDDFDGYALQDLLVDKWGAQLDIDFQRDASLSNVYCNILPIAFGQRLKCRHETELEYLMHLQGIVEVLRKYDQLDAFVLFIEQTNKRPKAGTDSVPFRLNLNDEQKRQIL